MLFTTLENHCSNMDASETLSTESYKSSHISCAVNNPEEYNFIYSFKTSIMEAVPDAGLESRSRVVCSIAFEEYLRAWVKIATTKAVHLMRKESLDELIQCPERFAAHYGISGSGSYDLTLQQRKVFKIAYGPGLKKCTKRNLARVNQMRRIYLLCSSPDLQTPQISERRNLVRDLENQECWEGEVDKLLAWTHSLSFEELDRQ